MNLTEESCHDHDHLCRHLLPRRGGGDQPYEAIGGRAAVTAAVDRFYRRMLADPALAAFFPNGVGARHRAYLVTILGEALGGPERYRGPDIAGAHHGLASVTLILTGPPATSPPPWTSWPFPVTWPTASSGSWPGSGRPS
jgi:truncated hemoglobin YjbI